VSRSHSTLALVLLMMIAFAGRRPECFLPSPAGAVEELPLCNLNTLPSDIQSRLKVDFRSWKVKEPENLSKYTRETWAGRKPAACPGIAVGLFQNAKTPSYAFLLVPIDHPDAGYRFLVFSRKTGQPSYEMIVVERSDDHGASNLFIRKVLVRDFFNEQSSENSKYRLQNAS